MSKREQKSSKKQWTKIFEKLSLIKLVYFEEMTQSTINMFLKKLIFFTKIMKSISLLSNIHHLTATDWQTFSRSTQLRLKLRRLTRLGDGSRLPSSSAGTRFCRCAKKENEKKIIKIVKRFHDVFSFDFIELVILVFKILLTCTDKLKT